MAYSFDAYHQWLGISSKDQPPNHYRLLGVDLFESDPNVISNAADQRMAHVRSFQTGQHAAESQKVLNEIAAARVCLLNPKKKARYDEHLRYQEAEAQGAATTGIDEDLAQLLGAEQPGPASGTRSLPRPPVRTHRSVLPMAIGAVACIVLIVLVFAVLRRGQTSAPAEPSGGQSASATQGQATRASKATSPKAESQATPLAAQSEGQDAKAESVRPNPQSPNVLARDRHHSWIGWPSSQPVYTLRGDRPYRLGDTCLGFEAVGNKQQVCSGTVFYSLDGTDWKRLTGLPQELLRDSAKNHKSWFTVTLPPAVANQVTQEVRVKFVLDTGPDGIVTNEVRWMTGSGEVGLRLHPVTEDPKPSKVASAKPTPKAVKPSPPSAPAQPSPSSSAESKPPFARSVPSAEDQEKAEQAFRGVYAQEAAAARQPDAKGMLAERLLDSASKMNGKAADLFVLLRHTVQLAAEGGRCDLVLQAIDMQAEHYAVAIWPTRVEALGRALKAPLPAKSREAVVEQCLDVVDEAIAGEEYEAAEELAKLTLAACRKIRALEPTRQIAERAGELRTVRKAYEAGAEAADVLAKDPNNAVANVTRGKYLVTLRHDWTKGLTHLAKGDDSVVAEAAAADMAEPGEPAKQVELGDTWLKAADETGGLAARAYVARAAWWYDRALPELEGLARARVEKRRAGLKISPADRIPPCIGLKDPDNISPGKVAEFKFPTNSLIMGIAAMPDGRSFFATGGGGHVVRYNLATGAVLFSEKKGEMNYGIAISPDGRKAVCGGQDSLVRILDLKSKTWSQIPTEGWLLTPFFFQDSRRLLYATSTGTRAFDIDTRRELFRWAGTGYTYAVAIPRNERTVLTVGGDRITRLLDAANGREVQSLKGHTSWIICADVTADGRWCLTGSADKTARLWDLRAGKVVHVLAGHAGPVSGVRFIQDGRYAVTAGGSLRLWNVARGKLVEEYPINVSQVCALPDDRFVLCAHQGIIYLWRRPLNAGKAFSGKTAPFGSTDTRGPIAKQKEASEVTRSGK